MIDFNNKGFFKLKKSNGPVPPVISTLLINGENIIGMYV